MDVSKIHLTIFMPFLGILFILELFIWHIFGKDCRLWKPQMCHYDDFINYRKYARKTTIHTYLFSTISVMWVQESATDPLYVQISLLIVSYLINTMLGRMFVWPRNQFKRTDLISTDCLINATRRYSIINIRRMLSTN